VGRFAWGFAAAMLLFAASLALSRCRRATGGTVRALVSRIDALEAWGERNGVQLPSERGWRAYIRVARAVQRSDPAVVAAALRTFGQPPAFRAHGVWCDVPATRAILLLRVVFDVPEDATAPDYGPMLPAVPLPGFPGLCHDGRYNLAWPVSWKGGHPHVIARMAPGSAMPYDPVAEYRRWLRRYPMRRLPRD